MTIAKKVIAFMYGKMALAKEKLRVSEIRSFFS
jgi:hypothetical protein